MPPTDSKPTPEPPREVRCFLLGGEICHAFVYEQEPQPGQACVCGQARLGSIDTGSKVSYNT